MFRGIHPRIVGIGYASILASYAITLYYNVMIAWSLIYLIASFINPLPWSRKRAQSGTNYKTCPNLFITEEFFYKDIARTIDENCILIDT